MSVQVQASMPAKGHIKQGEGKTHECSPNQPDVHEAHLLVSLSDVGKESKTKQELVKDSDKKQNQIIQSLPHAKPKAEEEMKNPSRIFFGTTKMKHEWNSSARVPVQTVRRSSPWTLVPPRNQNVPGNKRPLHDPQLNNAPRNASRVTKRRRNMSVKDKFEQDCFSCPFCQERLQPWLGVCPRRIHFHHYCHRMAYSRPYNSYGFGHVFKCPICHAGCQLLNEGNQSKFDKDTFARHMIQNHNLYPKEIQELASMGLNKNWVQDQLACAYLGVVWPRLFERHPNLPYPFEWPASMNTNVQNTVPTPPARVHLDSAVPPNSAPRKISQAPRPGLRGRKVQQGTRMTFILKYRQVSFGDFENRHEAVKAVNKPIEVLVNSRHPRFLKSVEVVYIGRDSIEIHYECVIEPGTERELEQFVVNDVAEHTVLRGERPRVGITRTPSLAKNEMVPYASRASSLPVTSRRNTQAQQQQTGQEYTNFRRGRAGFNGFQSAALKPQGEMRVSMKDLESLANRGDLEAGEFLNELKSDRSILKDWHKSGQTSMPCNHCGRKLPIQTDRKDRFTNFDPCVYWRHKLNSCRKLPASYLRVRSVLKTSKRTAKNMSIGRRLQQFQHQQVRLAASQQVAKPMNGQLQQTTIHQGAQGVGHYGVGTMSSQICPNSQYAALASNGQATQYISPATGAQTNQYAPPMTGTQANQYVPSVNGVHIPQYSAQAAGSQYASAVAGAQATQYSAQPAGAQTTQYIGTTSSSQTTQYAPQATNTQETQYAAQTTNPQANQYIPSGTGSQDSQYAALKSVQHHQYAAQVKNAQNPQFSVPAKNVQAPHYTAPTKQSIQASSAECLKTQHYAGQPKSVQTVQYAAPISDKTAVGKHSTST
eukprot:CAMPEP_0114513354 /NCGR_PEP_ID=MMETSP0109-20121206/15514_1 /TAXON_ID=29199 /ORGANISM="Chlorarachnion reptans, Strain CCCM449" /LENGTH=875 /DNA_ID=CAMNT_0001693199 /DNA_START=153 /DNA_END=2780 /DNA_ORIENTATION=+